MQRINKLLQHPAFIENLNRLNALEADRTYCRHGLSHLLDVARIALILQYQEQNSTDNRCAAPFSEETIYAAALLHDIGRVLQYEQGLPHETAGLCLARQILQDCSFTKTEQALILDAIQFHRTNNTEHAENPSYADNIINKNNKHNKNNINNKNDKNNISNKNNIITEASSVSVLRSLLHRADKLSRNCFACAASDSCYWPETQKNKGITC